MKSASLLSLILSLAVAAGCAEDSSGDGELQRDAPSADVPAIAADQGADSGFQDASASAETGVLEEVGVQDMGVYECRPAGDYDEVLSVGGTDQRFRIHVPPGRTRPVPMVLQLHGGGSTGGAMDVVSGLSALADTEGFVVVTPEGWPVNGVGPQVWNAGACCGPTDRAPDHVEVLERILTQTLEQDSCIDPKRVYATGHSNGAMMAYRLACELERRVAAVAISAGSLVNEDLSVTPPVEIYPCAPSRAVSVLHVHGLQDLCVPYAGGLSRATGNILRPVEEVVSTWRQINGCGQGTDMTNGEVRRRKWPCREGTSVELITVERLGHAWAGSPTYGSQQRCGGSTTTLVSTTQELWRFLQGQRLP